MFSHKCKNISLLILICSIIACNERAGNCEHLQDKFGKYLDLKNVKKDNLDLQSLTLLGFYNEASIRYLNSQSSDLNPLDTSIITFNSIRSEPAKPHILNLAKESDILILNETHDLAYLRIFATELLEGLKEHGYSIFAIETLDIRDSLINQRKVPLRSSGVYSKEPLFGNLLRQALKLGYDLYPYECTPTDSSNGSSRDRVMARKVDEIMHSHPDQKMFIFCGAGHGSYHPDLMGGILKSTGKYKIASIDQITYCVENKSRKQVNHKLEFECESVLIDDQNSIFVHSPELYDMTVVHPDYDYSLNKRPDWISKMKNRRNYFAPRNFSDYGYTIAYIKKEFNKYFCDAIPMDIQWHHSGEDSLNLILPTGSYSIFEIGSKDNYYRSSVVIE